MVVISSKTVSRMCYNWYKLVIIYFLLETDGIYIVEMQMESGVTVEICRNNMLLYHWTDGNELLFLWIPLSQATVPSDPK